MGCKVVVQVTAILALCFELHFGVAIIQHDRRHHVRVLGSDTSPPLLHCMDLASVLSCACVLQLRPKLMGASCKTCLCCFEPIPHCS